MAITKQQISSELVKFGKEKLTSQEIKKLTETYGELFKAKGLSFTRPSVEAYNEGFEACMVLMAKEGVFKEGQHLNSAYQEGFRHTVGMSLVLDSLNEKVAKAMEGVKI